ncbi:TetR/AcrR family transcriptional regulator [Brachybacterium phenoliresistens]|uniref:TetR/AcrR family transcriptional regulator n=1 Tax=Brachybacterium phenoliresistens TaxID=396014 RepID=UPI0031D060AB
MKPSPPSGSSAPSASTASSAAPADPPPGIAPGDPAAPRDEGPGPLDGLAAPGEGASPAAPAVDGRSARWAAHRETRRAEMLRVARKLIHAQGPDVTMEDIAVASGTSKSIVYRYFTDKAQLQRAIGMHILSDMHRQLVEGIARLEQEAGGAVDAEARIRVMISAYVSTAESSPNVYRFVTRPSDGLNHFLSSTARLVAAAVPDSSPSPEVWAAGAVGFVRGAVDRWMTDRTSGPAGGTITDDQLIDHLVTWLMKGMRH